MSEFKFRPYGATAGGKVYSYRAGTYIEKVTYSDANLSVPNTNPVILDSRAEANVFIKGPTKLVLKDAEDNIIWTFDDYKASNPNILDTNNNELLEFVSEDGAVNYFNISNAATGNSPSLSSVGSDTNIGISLKPKGSGKLKIPTGNLTISSGNITLLAGDLNISTGNLVLSSGDLNCSSGSVTISDTTSSFASVPIGLVIWNGSSTVPSGWLECNGSAISRTTYASLFSIIGTTFGSGDGSTTFNLPNQARRTIVGKGGSGTATLGNSIGSTGGAETHTLSTSELPAHTHSYFTRYTTSLSRAADYGGGATSTQIHAGVPYVSTNTNTTGSGAAHNIMQPSLVSMMIIRAF